MLFSKDMEELLEIFERIGVQYVIAIGSSDRKEAADLNLSAASFLMCKPRFHLRGSTAFVYEIKRNLQTT
ncbi:MAG: hypothetical protein O7G87_05520, partial [bacterium]|nr:hypothetical protein [bacterium]